jgi:hypothetical protein
MVTGVTATGNQVTGKKPNEINEVTPVTAVTAPKQ